MNEQHDLRDLPEEFWSEYTDQPFEVCLDCGVLLHDHIAPYIIQKHFVAGEAVFELALCLPCASRLQAGFSVESRQAIIDRVRTSPERQRRHADVLRSEQQLADCADPNDEHERRRQFNSILRERALGSCAVCGKLRTECHRYSAGTACLGLSLITAAPGTDDLGSPFLICEDCERQLNECLSKQTRDAWDRFVDEHFDGPPALAVDPRDVVAIF